jgi:hypothetical protein
MAKGKSPYSRLLLGYPKAAEIEINLLWVREPGKAV